MGGGLNINAFHRMCLLSGGSHSVPTYVHGGVIFPRHILWSQHAFVVLYNSRGMPMSTLRFRHPYSVV